MPHCTKQEENETNKIILSSYDVAFDYGYNVLNKQRIFLYPILGVGFSWSNLKIIDKSVESETFDQAISNLNGMQEIYTSGKLCWILNIGAKFDWSITKEKDWLIGFDLGYRLQLSELKWKTNNSNLSDAPNIYYSGFYTGLHLTFY